MSRLSALDIANFYVQLANSLPETEITNLKLNKLCYYAQAWSLVRLGTPLFDDVVEAWEYGPVLPKVYHTYKVCGKGPIAEAADYFDESRLSSEELSLLTDVYLTYGKYTPYELISMTHRPCEPWQAVYDDSEDKPISVDMIRSYFANSDELQTMRIQLTPENVVSYE